MQSSVDACAFRLNRSLTLDPSGGLNADEEQPCYPVLDSCTTSGPARGSSPSPTPFVAAGAVSRSVVSAFQGPPENAAPLGSVFRSQETIIESTSSDETSCANAGSSSRFAPQLSCTLSTPMEGSIGIAEPAPSQAGFIRQASAFIGAQGSCPAHGVKAVCGKRNKMEDMYAVQPNFFDIPLSPTADDLRDKLPQHIAGQMEAADNSPTSSAPLSPSGAQAQTAAGDQSINSCGTASDTGTVCDTLHFFGVYDGHGGCQAAEHCAKRLHHHLSLALAAACGCLIQDGDQLLHMPAVDQSTVDWNSSLVQSVANFACQTLARQDSASPLLSSAAAVAQAGQQQHQPECARVYAQRRLLGKSSGDSDTSSSPDEHALYPLPENDAFDTDSSGGSGSDRLDGVSVTGMLEEALKEAFVKTDAEFASDGCAAMVGSTALVALVGTRRLWLANCGDSRAVLCRNGKAIQLTDDHKPEREDEAERVEKAGGQVLFWNGHRVMGVLAMSRAIGDHGLRPYIIPEPEVSVVCRTDEDDFLLLASDGLWDVMANQEATNLCIRCIKRAREKGASRNAAVRIAASVLTKAAIDRGSKDNVTVVIVDLRNEKSGGGSGGMAVQPAAAEASSVGQAPACGDGDPPCMLKPPQEAEHGAVELPVAPIVGGGFCLPASGCGCAAGSCSCGGRSGGGDGGGPRLVEAAAVAVAAQGARASG